MSRAEIFKLAVLKKKNDVSKKIECYWPTMSQYIDVSTHIAFSMLSTITTCIVVNLLFLN